MARNTWTPDDVRRLSDVGLLNEFVSPKLSDAEAREWLDNFQTLTLDRAGPRKLHAAFELARRLTVRELATAPILSAANPVKEYLRLHFAMRLVEVFSVIYLDTRHRLLAVDDLFFGTLDSASVYPREIIRVGLQRNAGAVILAHNHPSGNAEPSIADIALTERLKTLLGECGMRLLDHVVVGQGQVVSMAERGLL